MMVIEYSVAGLASGLDGALGISDALGETSAALTRQLK